MGSFDDLPMVSEGPYKLVVQLADGEVDDALEKLRPEGVIALEPTGRAVDGDPEYVLVFDAGAV